jgi:hypothetical protein
MNNKIIEKKNELGTVKMIFNGEYENILSKFETTEKLEDIIKKINYSKILIEKTIFTANDITKDSVELFEKILDMNRSSIAQLEFKDIILEFDRKKSEWYIMESTPDKILVKDTSISNAKDYSENLSSSAKWLWETVIDNFSENFREWQKL